MSWSSVPRHHSGHLGPKPVLKHDFQTNSKKFALMPLQTSRSSSFLSLSTCRMFEPRQNESGNNCHNCSFCSHTTCKCRRHLGTTTGRASEDQYTQQKAFLPGCTKREKRLFAGHLHSVLLKHSIMQTNLLHTYLEIARIQTLLFLLLPWQGTALLSVQTQVIKPKLQSLPWL